LFKIEFYDITVTVIQLKVCWILCNNSYCNTVGGLFKIDFCYNS